MKESAQVRFAPGDPPALQIAAHYKFKNSGTTDLTFIDVTLPNQRSFGRQDLRVTVDGSEIAPAAPSRRSKGRDRTCFESLSTRRGGASKPVISPSNTRSVRPRIEGHASPWAKTTFISIQKDGSRNFRAEAPVAPAPAVPTTPLTAFASPADFVVSPEGLPKAKKKPAAKSNIALSCPRTTCRPTLSRDVTCSGPPASVRGPRFLDTPAVKGRSSAC